MFGGEILQWEKGPLPNDGIAYAYGIGRGSRNYCGPRLRDVVVRTKGRPHGQKGRLNSFIAR